MTDDREERIRARAHALWEAEGRPHGRHAEHWRRASDEEEAAGADRNPTAWSLGSAAQSDLLPPEAGRGSERPGSLVDTGPAIGLVAGTAGSAAGLGNLSLSQDTGEDRGGPDGERDGVAGGLSSIGAAAEEPARRARKDAGA